MPNNNELNKINELSKDAKNFSDFVKKIRKLPSLSSSVILPEKDNRFVGFDSLLRDKGAPNPNFIKSVSIVKNQLVANYGSEEKDIGGTWGEDALYNEIVLSRQLKKFKTEKSLMDLFLDKYPLSKNAGYIRKMRSMLMGTDYSNSVANVYVGNSFKSISVVDFKSIGEGSKNVELVVGALTKELSEGKNISVRKGWDLTVQKIFPDIVKVAFSSAKVGVSSKTVYIKEGERRTFDGIDVYVKNINVKEVAHLSLIPDIKHASSDANFTFKIGIEKRAIQLSPQKTQEMIDNLNVSIAKWQNIVDRLGSVVRGLKGACFATSAILMIKNMASGISGEVAARQKVMNGKYKQLCDSKYSSKSRTKCYNDLSKKIDKDVSSMTAALKSSNEEMKAAQKDNIGDSDGIFGGKGIINSTKYMDELRNKVGTKNISVDVGGDNILVPVSALSSPSQVQAVLTWQQAKKRGVGAIAKIDMDNALRNVALEWKSRLERREIANKLESSWNVKEINPNHISLLSNKKLLIIDGLERLEVILDWQEMTLRKKFTRLKLCKVKIIWLFLSDEANGQMAIEKVLSKKSNGWESDSDGFIEA